MPCQCGLDVVRVVMGLKLKVLRLIEGSLHKVLLVESVLSVVSVVCLCVAVGFGASGKVKSYGLGSSGIYHLDVSRLLMCFSSPF